MTMPDDAMVWIVVSLVAIFLVAITCMPAPRAARKSLSEVDCNTNGGEYFLLHEYNRAVKICIKKEAIIK